MRVVVEAGEVHLVWDVGLGAPHEEVPGHSAVQDEVDKISVDSDVHGALGGNYPPGRHARMRPASGYRPVTATATVKSIVIVTATMTVAAIAIIG